MLHGKVFWQSEEQQMWMLVDKHDLFALLAIIDLSNGRLGLSVDVTVVGTSADI